MIETGVRIFGWCLFAFWMARLLPHWWTLPRLWLPRIAPTLPDPANWPAVRVIVPARDEAATISAALRSLLASDYPNLQIIAVDDRSQDGTGQLMDDLAREDARLQVIHVTELPAGWLGKNHAMHLAATQASTPEATQGSTPWLIFTDGDVIYAPDAIRRAMQFTLAEKIDHLCLSPRFIAGSYAERSLCTYFGLIFLTAHQTWLIRTEVKDAYVGIGAFNLVRQSAYAAVGGHASLRLDVLDDVDLGKLLRYSGYRQALLFSGDLLRIRWQDSFWGVIRGLEKNCFAGVRYSVPRLIAITVLILGFVFLPYCGAIFAHGTDRLPFLMSLGLMHATYGYLGATFGSGWTVFPMLPLASLTLLFAFWRSAVLTLRRGGVRWRDTFYPLAELREFLRIQQLDLASRRKQHLQHRADAVAQTPVTQAPAD